MRYKRYGDDFLIDEIKPEEIAAEMVRVGDCIPNQEWQTIDNDESFSQYDHSVPEREMDLDHCKTEMREQTNLRILESIYGLIVGEQEGQSKQRVTYLQVNTLRKKTPL